MQTRNNYWMTFAAALLAVTCSVSLAQAGGHGFGGFGGRMGGGGFYRGGGSRLGGSMFRNNGQKYNHSNNNYNNNHNLNGWKNYPSNQQHVYKHNNGNNSPVIVNNPQPATPSVGDAVNHQQHNGSTHHKPDFLNNHKFQSNHQHHGDKTQGPVNGNTGIAGGLQPKHLPGKVIDPGSGSGSGNGNPPPVVHHHPHSPSHTHPPHHHHHNWSWVGFAAPWVYGVGNYRNGGYTTPTVINNTTVIEQPVVQASATEPAASDVAATGATAETSNNDATKSNDQVPDLTLKSISLFSAGSIAAGEGPVYRVVIANTSSVDVDRPFTVTVVAAKEDRSFDDSTPRTDEPVVSLAAGKEEGIDIHLPVEALSCEKDDQGNEAPFSTLLVVIDGYAKLGETNRDNNAAAVARTDVNAILPIVDSAETVAASGSRELNIAGQSFGEEQGKLMIDLGTVRVPAEVVSWEADSIKAKLPDIETAASVTTKLVVVRADGVSAEPFDLTQQEVAAK